MNVCGLETGEGCPILSAGRVNEWCIPVVSGYRCEYYEICEYMINYMKMNGNIQSVRQGTDN
jgi:hypothetical protein